MTERDVHTCVHNIGGGARSHNHILMCLGKPMWATWAARAKINILRWHYHWSSFLSLGWQSQATFCTQRLGRPLLFLCWFPCKKHENWQVCTKNVIMLLNSSWMLVVVLLIYASLAKSMPIISIPMLWLYATPQSLIIFCCWATFCSQHPAWPTRDEG